jgi:biotin carboxyl carrier protein
MIVPACAICVAPSDGRVRTLVPDGREVDRGDVVAAIDREGGSEPVRAPVRGRVGGPLAAASQQVARGEGILWLSR